MSQSAPWQASNFPNTQGPNVQLFDPTKFQTSNASSAANSTEQVPNGQSSQAGASNSWNSWGSWGDNSSTNQGYQGAMQGQGQMDVTQQQQEVINQNVGETVQTQPHGQSTGDQYYNQWNQHGWDPNNPQQGWDPNVQQSWNQQGQQAGEQGQQPQAYWDGHQWQWQAVDQSQSAAVPQQQQHHQHQEYQQQQQQHQQQHQDPSLSNSNTSGQFYDQISPDTSGNYSQSSASFQSHSAGLNDSTSSSFDQSSSSQPSASSQESPQAAEDSMNSEGGTVAGFFGKDDGDFVVDNSAESKLKSAPQFLNVDPAFQRTDSAISNASLQTMNLSSQGSVASLEELDMKPTGFQNQLQGVQQSEPMLSQPQFQSPPDINLNQNSDTSMPSVPQTREEEDHHSGNLNDWEIVPDQSSQTQAGVNFYIGGNQEQAVDNPQISVSQAGPAPVSGPPPFAAVATPPVGAPAAGFAGPPGQLLEGSPRPPPASSPAGSNPFRKSPRNVSRNHSNQSLPSLQGDNPGAGSPVIFSPEKPSNPEEQNVPSLDSIPKPAPSSIANSDSAFKPPVPKEPSDSVRKSENMTEPKPFAVLPDKMQPKPLDKDATSEKVKQESKEKSPDSKPPVGPGSRSAPMSPRKHTSAFHPVGHRAKHSMSPATTLWDNVDAPATNIILAPAAPVLSTSTTAAESGVKSPMPVIPIQASLETKLKDKTDRKTKGRELDKTKDGRRRDSKGGSERDDSRKKEDDNRSINSLDELDAQIDYRDNDDYRDGRYRDKYGYRDYRDPRDPRYDYDRPSSRADSYRDYGRRRDQYRPKDPRDPYSHGQYYDERYERPRSRQDEDRPLSRSGRDADPGKSHDYDRDGYYRERDRYRSNYYDYYRDPRYYDDQRYSNYYGRDQRYSQAYYDEYYRQQGYSTRYSDYYGSQYGAGGTEGEYDRYSHHSLSRGHTPALDDNMSSADYREHPHTNGSRSSSRQDYDEARDYARHGYSYDYGYDNYAYEYGQDPNYGYYGDYYGHDDRREAPGRLTPQKHTIPHVRACFGANGQLIKVLPNRPADGQPATVEVHSLEEMMADNREAEELKLYPGPLSKVDTHKNDVLQFCQKKAQSCAENINMVDRDSAELIWRLMELLIKQNGSVVGTDIADLLLEGHQPTSLEYSMMGMKITQSTEELDKVDDDASAGVKVTSDRSQVNKGRSLEEVTDRFRNLLLYGRKKDALEWATKNNLWGHALFLASKMDTRTHANVMIRFANSAMKMNDPLQTLYQLMSGRQPAAVTCVVDERWGDWRPHLAMILSNSSAKPELDRKSIAALGDTMASKGCLHASHFCYIMAQSSFGTYTKKTSKIVLIGSSHNSAWEDFATNEAIQCTEIYEYAQSLGNSGLVLPHFQVYKFLYATRLAEYGFLQEALHYCEVIANNVQQSPSWFQPAFVKVLYELSNRLKYHDPQRLHAAEEAEDPMWLQQLQRVSQGYDDGSIQPVSGNATPAMFGTSASSESGEVGFTGQGQGDYQYGQDQTYSQYGQDQTYSQYGQESSYQYGQDQSYQAGQYGQYGQAQAQSGQAQTGVDQSQPVDNGQTTEQQNQWQYNNYNYGYQQTGQTEHQPAGDVPDAGQQTESQPSTQTYGQQGYNQFGGGYTQDYMGSDRLASQRSSIVSAHSVDTEGSQDTRQEGLGGTGGAATFDYFEAATAQGKIVPPASRYRTTSGSSSTGSVRRQRTLSESSTGSVKMAPSMKKSQTDSSVTKKANSPQKQQQKKSGWFGGWFSGNKKKEMHLPKDDKQSIVWDPVEKRWKNTDGDDEDDGKPAMPPPKDIDLGAGGPPGMAAGAPSMGGPPAGNRFSLQKGRGARNQYVDVLSTKTTPAASVPSNLFNVLPPGPASTTTAAPTAQIFNPSGTVPESSSQPTATSGGQTSNQLEPPSGDQYQSYYYQPYTPGGIILEEQLSRSSSMSSLSREVQQLTNQPDATSSAITNPVMFDPTQFQPQQTQPAPSKGPKFGQRRQYPK